MGETDLGVQVLRSGYVFQTFAHTYLLTMMDLGLSKKQYKAMCYMLFSPAFIAGAGAVSIPFFSQIVAMIGAAFGIDDPEEDVYQTVFDTFGPTAEAFARHGVVGALGGVSLKGSMQLGHGGFPTTIVELLGAPGAVGLDIFEGGRLISRGDTAKGLERILPTAIGNMSRAIREYGEGVTTYGNAPLFFGDTQVAPDMTDAILRFVSFNPASMARISEIQRHERLVRDTYEDMRRDIYAAARRIYLVPREERDQSAIAGLISEINRYNKKVIARKANEPAITSKSIITNLKRSMKPSKHERLREQ